ncbi:MAG: WxL domain-containing protein [Actinomycetota bacterium]
MIIKSNSSLQLNNIGGVQVTTRFCASDTTNPFNNGYSPTDPWCQKFASGGNANAGGNSNVDADDAAAGTLQLMIAYRIPTTATAPDTITATEPSGGSAITFTKNTSYSSQLESLSAAGSGKQWVGYLSTAQSYTESSANQYFTVAPQFTLQQGADGSPFQGPFNYRVVVGFRRVNATYTASRTVNCGGNLYALYDDGPGAGICVDDPSSSTVASDLSQATRDLGVMPGSSTSVHAGATATVPFTLKYAGTTCFCLWTVSASTNIPGATATPAVTSITPTTDTTNPDNVTVNVPANTAPGPYTVTETADFTGTPTRTGTATLVVGAAFIFDPAPALLSSLGTVALNGQAQTTTAQMNNFGVNDTSGAASGWNVTVQGNTGSGLSKVFKQYCPAASAPCGSDPAGYVSGGRTLSADSLTLNTTAASWTGGTGSTPTFQCNAGCSVDHNTANKIASAASGGGTGLWSTSGFSATSLSLATPSTLRVLPANEQYHLDVIWTLNSGP